MPLSQRFARGSLFPALRAERDAFIAATALIHGMTVATRNVSDFAGTGAKLIHPWTD
jgi:predicted nucleic acid-binding protein